VEARLAALEIETPSWGYGDSGTRFATFQQPGRPRDVFERIDDAARLRQPSGRTTATAKNLESRHQDALLTIATAPASQPVNGDRHCTRSPAPCT